MGCSSISGGQAKRHKATPLILGAAITAILFVLIVMTDLPAFPTA